MTEPNPPSAGSVMTWVMEYLDGANQSDFCRHTAAVTTEGTVVENTAWLEGTTATAATLIRGLPELKLTKTVGPSDLIGPGEPITYTVTFSNEGSGVAAGVLVTDAVPNELTGVHATGSGAAITETGVISYSWQVEDLMPDQGGIITITGLVKTGLAGGLLVTNTAEIAAATQESDATDNTESVAVTVINVAPVAYDLSFSTAEDTPLNGTFSGEDANGDGLVYGIEDPPVEGTVDVTDSIAGAFVYTPTLNFNGLITFTYRVTDGLAFSNQAAVTVTVSPANDPPLPPTTCTPPPRTRS